MPTRNPRAPRLRVPKSTPASSASAWGGRGSGEGARSRHHLLGGPEALPEVRRVRDGSALRDIRTPIGICRCFWVSWYSIHFRLRLGNCCNAPSNHIKSITDERRTWNILVRLLLGTSGWSHGMLEPAKSIRARFHPVYSAHHLPISSLRPPTWPGPAGRVRLP